MRTRSGETGTPLGNTSGTTVPRSHSPGAVEPTSSSSCVTLISLEKTKVHTQLCPFFWPPERRLHRAHARSARPGEASMHSLAVSVLPLKSTEASLRTTLLGLVLLGFIYVKLGTRSLKRRGISYEKEEEKETTTAAESCFTDATTSTTREYY
ncbi:hypothetical protein D5086_016609 [Populus alba]|uniref:Uncharacterized protein n=1 Tax=Populus alba TaxID=43335 RepID=A0ACC4BVV8_POPAL